MGTWYKIFAGSLLLAGQVGILTGRQDPCTVPPVVVGVIDKNGQPVQNLMPGDFHAKLRGEHAQITSATYNQDPRRIVILLDSSGSMAGEHPKLQIQIVKELAAAVPPDTSLALLTFSEGIIDRMEFSPTPKTFVDRLSEFESRYLRELRGKTRLNDAIEEGLLLFGQPRIGDALFLLSDGEENGSSTSPGKLRHDLAHSGARLFAFFALSSWLGRARTPEEIQGANVLAMCEETGGDAVLIDDVENSPVIREKVHSLAIEMSGIYVVKVKLSGKVDKPREWKLEVETPGSKTKSRLHIIYPRRLMPCDRTGGRGHV